MRTKYLVTALALLGIISLAPTAHALLSPWEQYLCNQYRDNRFNAEYGFDTSDPWGFNNTCSGGGGGGGGYDPTYGGGGGYDPIGGGGGGGGYIPVPPRLPPIQVGGGASDTSDDTSGGYIPNPYTGTKPPRQNITDTGQKPWVLNNSGSSDAQYDTSYPGNSYGGWQGGMELDQNAVQSPMYHQESVRTYEDQRSAASYAEKPTAQLQRESFQVKAEAARKQFQTKLNTKIAEIAPMMQMQQDELQTQIETFTDTRKKTIVARMDEAFSSINKKWITTFTKSVDHLNGVLEAIISRTAKEQAAGKNVADVQAKIEVAQLAITNARGVLLNQTGNYYTLAVQDETTAKADVTTARDRLKKDLEAVRTAVRAAHEATKAAAEALRAVSGADAQTTNAK